MTPTSKTKSELPLAVWPCAQPTSQKHGTALPAQVARRAISTYTDPGTLVVDLTCDAGIALLEAIKLGRNALAVARNHTAARRAVASLNRACASEATGRAAVVQGDARELPRLLTRHRELLASQDATPSNSNVVRLGAGSVDLILTAPNVADAAEMHACARALKPGGFVAITTPSGHAAGALDDLAGQTVAVCEQAGLLYWQHVIALRAPIRDGKLAPHRLQVACHDDVLVFRKPDVAATATARPAQERRAA